MPYAAQGVKGSDYDNDDDDDYYYYLSLSRILTADCHGPPSGPYCLHTPVIFVPPCRLTLQWKVRLSSAPFIIGIEQHRQPFSCWSTGLCQAQECKEILSSERHFRWQQCH
jgi:hypothetical protein